MSGGGYILDWISSVISKYIEIFLAKQQKAKCVITGITYGPFKNKNIQLLAEQIIKLADNVFVRDNMSLRDIEEIGCNHINKVVPDIALREQFGCNMKKKQIVLVPFNRDLEYKANEICNDLKAICDEFNLSILVVVSQLWYTPMNVACKFFYKLRLMGCNVEMIIPKNYKNLQDILAESQLVLSQNLHGLILSYRSGTPIICLNTTRKFVSFMDMVGCKNQILSSKDISNNDIYNIYIKMLKKSNSDIASFRDVIDKCFEDVLR